MKITLVTSLCSLALVLTALGQTTPPPAPPDAATPVATVAPTISPAVAPVAPTAPTAPAVAPVATPVPVATPTATVAATPDDADDLESRIERKVKQGVHITIGEDDDDKREARRRERDRDRDEHIQIRGSDVGDGALMAIPIVGIIFTTLFGAPVMIVAVIMFFSYWKQRQLHRTVRMMVEKGQPVPEGLFAAPPASPMKQRSDMRRGVVLVMVGLALMIFFGATSDWDGGSWAIGIIPFLIGCGYLLVWKLEAGKVNTWKASTDNPPPLP